MKSKTRSKLKVTLKQKQAREVVDEFISEHGYPPSYRELMPLLGLKSANTVYYRLRGYRHKMVRS